jgi:hypothetical protein
MPNLYASKRPHDLHRCASAEEFRENFEARLGRTITDFVDGVVPAKRRAILLTGSIPDGIANAVSDVDLMVVADVDGAVKLKASGFGGGPASIKAGRPGALELAVVDGVVGGVETDIALISGPRLAALSDALERGGVSLQEDEIRTLGRIKRGWIMADEGDYFAEFPGLLGGLTLEIYCATTYYSLALKRLEDAFAAQRSDADLALHLGRLGVETALHAYLAATGYCYPSAKWPLFLKRHNDDPILDRGIALLFPPRAGTAADLRRYLTDAQANVADIRRLIERDRTLRIAFDYCPQIYWPDFALAAS